MIGLIYRLYVETLWHTQTTTFFLSVALIITRSFHFLLYFLGVRLGLPYFGIKRGLTLTLKLSFFHFFFILDHTKLDTTIELV